MIGMHHFKHFLTVAIMACFPTMLLGEDVVEMADGSTLNGALKSISAEGEIQLTSSLSAKDLRLSAKNLKSVRFASNASNADDSLAQLLLSNSDDLPVTIDSLDSSALCFKSPDFGGAQVNRGGVQSIRFIEPNPRSIYAGPLATDRWRQPDVRAAGWEFREDTLTTFQNASSIYNFEKLPIRYSLEMTFSWQNQPNFEVRFGNSTNFSDQPSNQYLLSFTSNGIELRRESNAPNRLLTVLLWQPQMNQWAEKQAKIELRVDRLQSRIYLRFNGERVAVGFDPLEKNPNGTGIMISGGGTSDNQLVIREMKLSEINDARGPFAVTQSANLELDCIVTRDDDRLSGQIESIQATAEGLLFRFVSDFQETPLELLDSDLCYVYFAKADLAKTVNQQSIYQKFRSLLSKEPSEDAENGSAKSSLYQIGLSSGGKLSADAIHLTDANMQIEHSLLGTVTIPRNRITWIINSANSEQTIESP
ncbi:MAG: hypothetical protein EAZ42_10195 [Verrucomicrobia bacterium]|nr:MAG: hypothetical protein EAZ42_10195 [Verrucomicrobiota bacterium]